MINDFAIASVHSGQQIEEALLTLGLAELLSLNGLRFLDLPPAIRDRGVAHARQRAADG